MPANQPRKHHYLPQFYLRSFADMDGRIWQCDRKSGKLVALNVSKAAAEKDYHRFDVQNPEVDQFGAEKLMADVEGVQATVLQAVLQNPDELNRHRVELLGLTQFMFYRVPKVRDMLVNATTEMLNATVKVLERQGKFGDMPEVLKQRLDGKSITEVFRLKPKNWFVVLKMLELANSQEIYRLLYHRQCSLLMATGFRPFITGDAAVPIFDRNVEMMQGKAAGFASPTAEFTLALSPRLLLVISHERPAGVFKVGDDAVREFNRRTIVWSERYLFGESFDAVTLRDVMELSERRAGFSSQNLEAPDGIYTISRMKPVHPALLA